MVIDTSLIKSLETSLGLYKAEYPIRLVDMQLSYPNHDITGDEDQYTLIIDSEIINHIIAKTLVLKKEEADYLAEHIGQNLDANFYMIKTEDFSEKTNEIPYTKMEEYMVIYLSINEINKLVSLNINEERK